MRRVHTLKDIITEKHRTAHVRRAAAIAAIHVALPAGAAFGPEWSDDFDKIGDGTGRVVNMEDLSAALAVII